MAKLSPTSVDIWRALNLMSSAVKMFGGRDLPLSTMQLDCERLRESIWAERAKRYIGSEYDTRLAAMDPSAIGVVTVILKRWRANGAAERLRLAAKAKTP